MWLANSKQSTIDVQFSEPLEQMGSTQLISYIHRQTTSYDDNITEETPRISDVQSEPWEHMGSPQLKFDTNRLVMSYDINGTEKNQLTSYV